MSLDEGIWYETCNTCLGEGCNDCDQEGLVPHGSQPDDVAALVHQDEQIKAHLKREAQIVGYFRHQLLDEGLTEQQIGPLLDSLFIDRQHD